MAGAPFEAPGPENCDVLVADRQSLDLTSQAATEKWLADRRPDAVSSPPVASAASMPTTPTRRFIADNAAIALNVIRGAIGGVKKLLFLGSSCIYPKLAPQR